MERGRAGVGVDRAVLVVGRMGVFVEQFPRFNMEGRGQPLQLLSVEVGSNGLFHWTVGFKLP